MMTASSQGGYNHVLFACGHKDSNAEGIRDQGRIFRNSGKGKDGDFHRGHAFRGLPVDDEKGMH